MRKNDVPDPNLPPKIGGRHGFAELVGEDEIACRRNHRQVHGLGAEALNEKRRRDRNDGQDERAPNDGFEPARAIRS